MLLKASQMEKAKRMTEQIQGLRISVHNKSDELNQTGIPGKCISADVNQLGIELSFTPSPRKDVHPSFNSMDELMLNEILDTIPLEPAESTSTDIPGDVVAALVDYDSVTSIPSDTPSITPSLNTDPEWIQSTTHIRRHYRHRFPRKSFPPTKPMQKVTLPYVSPVSPHVQFSADFDDIESVSNSISISSPVPKFQSIPGFTQIPDSCSSESGITSYSESFTPIPDSVSQQLIRKHFDQKYSLNPFVHFDRASITKSNGKVIALSSKPLIKGEYEWTLEITRCDVDIQEIGVCTVCDTEGIQIADGGVTKTTALGARGIYGSELANAAVWYTSLNENGVRRCFKDLASSHQIGWTTKDQIKVMFNLDRFRVKFYRNGRKVSSGRIRLNLFLN